MRWSYQRRMRSGEFITCRAPYGYRLCGHSLVVYEDEAVIVRRIFAEFLAGESAKNIAAALSAEGIAKCHGQWVEKSVRAILQNEKYAGNVLLQKRYTTSTIPFKQVKNNGEQEMFFIENSHPAIIRTEDFARARELQRQRFYSPSLPRRQYPFSQRIVCGECGHNFTRKMCRGKTYWVCRAHDNNRQACTIRQIPEPHMEAAFVRLWNKLRDHRYDIVYPLLQQLESLKTLAARRNKKVYEIDIQLNSLIQQHHMLNLLRTKGYVDTVIFMEKVNELNTSVATLRRERQSLLDDEDGDPIGATKYLLEALETGPQVLSDFDPAYFDSIVDKIIAVSQTEVRFRLINGIELTETVERIKR